MSLPFLRAVGSDCDLDVLVQPGARKTALGPVHGDRIKVAISAPPTDGRANDAVVRFFADLVGIAPSMIELRRGASDRRKTLRFCGVSEQEVLRLLIAAGLQIQTTG